MVKEIRIQLDYLHGPLWKEHFDPTTGEWSTGIAIIDNDVIIQRLNDEASGIYEGLYSFETDGTGFRFDEERYAQVRPRIRNLIRELIERLDEINDGSFVIIDDITSKLA